MLYNKDLEGWKAWGEAYQDIPAFTPLAKEIYRISGIDFVPLTPLSPGTNAVFRSGDTVIKIYTPDETGLSGKVGYDVELFAMRHAIFCGFPAPKVLASGFIDDKYRFYYIIMEHINAPEFTKARKSMSHERMVELADTLGQRLKKLNIPVEKFTPQNALEQVEGNKRWDKMPKEFREEAMRVSRESERLPLVYVHGDLNCDNILFMNDEMYVIDFADSNLAPVFYESVCVLIDPFDLDLECAEAFTGLCGEDLAQHLYNGLLLHDFGADIIMHNIKERFGEDAVNSPTNLLKALRNWAKA